MRVGGAGTPPTRLANTLGVSFCRTAASEGNFLPFPADVINFLRITVSAYGSLSKRVASEKKFTRCSAVKPPFLTLARDYLVTESFYKYQVTSPKMSLVITSRYQKLLPVSVIQGDLVEPKCL